jgi:hypothetical protein
MVESRLLACILKLGDHAEFWIPDLGSRIWADCRRRVDAIGNPIEGEASSKLCPKRGDQKSVSSAKLSIGNPVSKYTQLR